MFNRIFSNSGNSSNEKSDNSFEMIEFSRVIIKKIEDIPEHYADVIKEIILKEEFYKMALFLSGDFIVDYVDEKNYTCSYILYFQDQNDASYQMEAKSKPLDTTRLSEETKKVLSEQKTIKFDIPEPSEEFRKKYKLAKI